MFSRKRRGFLDGFVVLTMLLSGPRASRMMVPGTISALAEVDG